MSINIMKDGDPMPEKARFIVSKASAGSGKTFQLVLIYLTLALSVDESLDEKAMRKALEKRFTRILAITFTNAAVNEMKQRILTELDALCDDSAEKRPLMEEKLCQTTGLEAEELRRRAKVVYNAILHHYSDLAVCTIDSFANRIVKTFAHDMNLPQNFDISLDENELIDKVSDNIMALIGTDGEEDLTTLLYTYSEEKMEDEGGYDIERNLKAMIPYVLRENASEYIAKLDSWTLEDYRSLRKEFAASNKTFETTLEAKAKVAKELIKESGIDEAMFFHGTSSAPGYFKNIIDKKYAAPNSYAKSFFEGDKDASPRSNEATRDAIIAIKPQLVEIYNEIEAIRESGLKQYHTRKRLMANLYEIGLMKRINDAMEVYYDENDLLHISEVNKRIAQVVGNSDDTPFIYERIGNVYQNILIDEFQDTARQQWGNLVPLVENSVSEGHTSLVVGDGKQAIYRFREGDVRQFAQLPKVEGRTGLNIENPEIFTPFPKKDNWRSRPEVVKFNNSYFAYVVSKCYADNEYLRDIYIGERLDDEDDLVQHYKEDDSKASGFVKLAFSKKNDDLWEQIADEVEHQHELGFDYDDICVLAPQHSHLSKVSEILLSRGVKITSKESQRLENSHLVRLVLETMRCLNNPTDRCAMLKVLVELEYMGRIGQSYRERMMKNKYATLREMLSGSGIEIDFDALGSLSLYDLCESLLRLYNADQFENAYGVKLLNIVADYSRLHRQSIGDFLQWMDSHIEKQSLTLGGDDAVPLQTIHTAKGLQWPVVIVALPQIKGNPPKKMWVEVEDSSLSLPVGLVTPTSSVSTLFDQQFDDERKLTEMDTTNMIYVALTRPGQKLVVYTTCTDDASKGAPSHQKFLKSFAEEYLKDSTSAKKSKEESDKGVQYTFGVDHSSETAKMEHSGSRTITTDRITFPDYLDRIDYARHANEERNAGEERHFGTMVHEILSHIDTADDMEAALKRYARINHLDAEDLPIVRKLLEATVNGADSRRFFEAGLKVKKEAPLMFNGKELRPDRIVFMDGETWVVDYKTGTVRESHKAQVQEYCAAMEAMGYPSVKGYLLYLNDEGCMVEGG